MKTILCFGDSLTWGAIPGGLRHEYGDRWPTVLGEELGEANVQIITDGLNGRTTIFDDFAVAADRNGARVLPTLLESHMPLDLVIIMLGTNDLKNYLCGNVAATTRGIGRIIEIIKNHQYYEEFDTPQILIISPPRAGPSNDPMMGEVFEGATEKSQQFSGKYQELAELNNCAFFDAATIATASPIDGVHLDVQNTRAIGKNIAPLVATLLNIQSK